jgi:hypothetical protein
LVNQHLRAADELAAGIHALPSSASSFASTQAAWRFLNNPAITLPVLVQPLHQAAWSQLPEQVSNYALIVHDWSLLSYQTHQAKTDRLSNGPSMQGYDLYTALLISDRTGEPIAPLHQALSGSQGTFSTHSDTVYQLSTHQQHVDCAVTQVEALEIAHPCVHIIDQGLDALEYFRRWDQQHSAFVVRVDAKRLVLYRENECLLRAVVEQLIADGSLRLSRSIDSDGRLLQQYVAEASVILHRPARPRAHPGRATGKDVVGEPLPLRLIVAQLRDESQKLVSQWLLLTNLRSSVDAEQIVQWYYWRWKIESFFKLLKSAGHHLEEWQQQTAIAIARRLLVASMACVIVWRLAADSSPQAEQVRAVLVRLSGRQMRWGTSFTHSALLAGCWTLLAMLDALEHVSVKELRNLADLILSGRQSDNPP